MLQTVFLIGLTLVSGGYLVWGWKTLPGEGWQIAASVPLRKREDGHWSGVNLTWYGILTANAYAAAVALALVLMGAAGISLQAVTLLVMLLLACCVPASRLVAQVVEGKANTFTVGGAVFVGTLLAPWLVGLVNLIPPGDQGKLVPVLPALAAFAVAYAFGEGMGRLACVSFGCCYGKPLSSCHPTLARLAAPFAWVFTGKTKKIAYASGLDGVKVLPVQGFTCLLYTATGIVSTWLFLNGSYGAAYFLVLLVTQGWRVVSEFFRSDFRGSGRLSAYQWMGTVGICYGAWAVQHLGTEGSAPRLPHGLDLLRSPGTFLFLQALWIAIFLYTGLSRVTGSTLSFHVHTDRV